VFLIKSVERSWMGLLRSTDTRSMASPGVGGRLRSTDARSVATLEEGD